VFNDEKRMTFTEHLSELRSRLIYSLAALAASVVLCYIFSNFLLEMLGRPLTPLAERGFFQAGDAPAAPEGADPATPRPADTAATPKWTVLNPLEIVLVKLRLAGYLGLVLAFPFILYQICAFVFPGLRDNERRAVLILIYGCSVLAAAGVLVAYFGVMPLFMPYVMSFVPDGWEVQLRASETISLILLFLAAFAVAFQFPMAVLILVYMGLLTPATLKKYRRLAIVGLTIISAILTPPDPMSMLIMMFPLFLLYEGSIWLSYLVVWRREQAGAER